MEMKRRFTKQLQHVKQEKPWNECQRDFVDEELLDGFWDLLQRYRLQDLEDASKWDQQCIDKNEADGIISKALNLISLMENGDN